MLIEHQSTDDPWVPVRVFKYIATIWDDIRKKWPKGKAIKIPLIFPMVIYNGVKPYSHTLSLKEMITPLSSQAIFADLFVKPLQILDLAAVLDQEIRAKTQQSVTLYAFMMILKHIFNEDLPQLLQTGLLYYFKEMERSGHRELLITMLSYAYKLNEYLNEQQFHTFIEHEFSKEVQGGL